MKNAENFFHKYLATNISDADVLERMKEVINEFVARAPKVVVMKCIDGRTHGSNGKGYPPTTIQFGRTDGNKVSLDKSNFWFWNRIDRVVKDAHFNTPRTPALFIAFMHYSPRPGLGCSSHKSNDAEALKSVEAQTVAVRETYKSSELYVLGGATNTDCMAETLIFPEGVRISTEEIIQYCHLENPRNLFHEFFLTHPFNDVATSRNVNFKLPEELLAGITPEFFCDFETCINMESYLLREITTILGKDKGDLKRLIRPDIVDYIFTFLEQVKIPELLVGPIIYQIIWNIAYTLYQMNYINQLDEDKLARHIAHAEEMLSYGDGFETLPRNFSVLVKSGRGDDIDALQVAKEVLTQNRLRYKQDHKLLAHINIETNGEMMKWDDFNENVGSRVKTMLRNIDHVFGDEVAILTTYSYRDQKRFYPVKIEREDSRMVYYADVIAKINAKSRFSNISLKAQEANYIAGFVK